MDDFPNETQLEPSADAEPTILEQLLDIGEYDWTGLPQLPADWNWTSGAEEPNEGTLQHELWQAARDGVLPAHDIWSKTSHSDRFYFLSLLVENAHKSEAGPDADAPYDKPPTATLRQALWEAATDEYPPDVDAVPPSADLSDRKYYAQVLRWSGLEIERAFTIGAAPDAVPPRPEDKLRGGLWDAATEGVLPPAWIREEAATGDVTYYEDIRARAKHSYLVERTWRKAPMNYFGGKGILVPQLLPLFPPHTEYFEPYGGSGRVLLCKRRAEREFYNDRDRHVAALFRSIQNTSRYVQLRAMAILLFPARSVHKDALELLARGPEEMTRALGTYVTYRFGYKGMNRSYGLSGEIGDAKAHTKYRNSVRDLSIIHRRLQGVTISNDDALWILGDHQGEDTLIYLDPPYTSGTRKSPKAYRHELPTRAHQQLAALLPKLQGKFILSGYDDPIYNPLLDAGWVRFWTDVRKPTGTGNKRAADLARERGEQPDAKAVESIWVSPNIAEWVRWVARNPKYGWTEA